MHPASFGSLPKEINRFGNFSSHTGLISTANSARRGPVPHSE
jgi:hypothetical protein